MGPAGCRGTATARSATKAPADAPERPQHPPRAPQPPRPAPAAPPAPRQHQARKSAGGGRKVADFFGVCVHPARCGPFGLKFLSRTQNRPSFQSVKVSAKKMPCTARCGSRKVAKFQKVQNVKKCEKSEKQQHAGARQCRGATLLYVFSDVKKMAFLNE